MNLFLYNASTVLCFCTAVGLGSASSQAGVRDVPLLKRRDVSVNRQLLSKVSITRNTNTTRSTSLPERSVISGIRRALLAVPIIIEIRSKEGNLKFPGRNYICHSFYCLVTVFINVQIDFIKCISYHKI